MTHQTDPNPASEWPIDWLRQTSPYINTHRGKTFVVWFSSEMLDAPEFTSLVHDLTLLSHLGIRLVLSHGMRSQIDTELSQRQIAPQFGTDSYSAQSMRITTTESLPALSAAIGNVRCKLESSFSTGLPNSPMSGARISLVSGNFIVAKPYGIRDNVDYQHTGEIRKLRVQKIKHLLDSEMVALLSPIGYSPTGELFNLLSEDVALQAAIALGADKLIYLHQHASSINNNVHELSTTDQEEPSELLTDENESGSVRSVIERCKDACQRGVERCHIVDATNSDALLRELFTRDGSGLLIDKGNYDNIRSATTNDVSGIMALIKPLMADGTLVFRSEQDLEREIHTFHIIEREGSVICCASLNYFDNYAELGCLAVHPDLRASGKATDMLQHLKTYARHKRCKILFGLSTRTGDWFLEQGFKEDSNDTLPVSRQSSSNRGSKLYTLAL